MQISTFSAQVTAPSCKVDAVVMFVSTGFVYVGLGKTSICFQVASRLRRACNTKITDELISYQCTPVSSADKPTDQVISENTKPKPFLVGNAEFQIIFSHYLVSSTAIYFSSNWSLQIIISLQTLQTQHIVSTIQSSSEMIEHLYQPKMVFLSTELVISIPKSQE